MEPMKPMEPMKGMKPMAPMTPMSAADDSWYPQGLSNPSSSGGQNGLDYAFFPDQRRLAIRQGGAVTTYDTGDHQISGVSQQQSAHAGTPSFTSQTGTVDLASLQQVG